MRVIVFVQVHTRMLRSDEMMTTLRLNALDGEARSVLSAAATAALEDQKEGPRLRVLLTGESLPAETIAALVAALRRLREHGGAIEAVGETVEVRAALTLHGLDRVFAFPIVPHDHDDETPGRGGRLRRFVRGAAASFAAALLLAGHPAHAQGASDTDPHALLQRVIERNPSLTSYQGRLHVDVQLHSFPFFQQHLDATTYYKRPSNYEVVFDRVPSYAKGFEKLFSDVGDPSEWEKRFVVSYDGQKEFRGRKDTQLRLVQRVRGMIDHETVLVDPVGDTVDQIRYDYYNGGHITMTQTFTQVGTYTMLAAQDAEISIPHVRAAAHGEFNEYKTNVAVDDAVFTKKN